MWLARSPAGPLQLAQRHLSNGGVGPSITPGIVTPRITPINRTGEWTETRGVARPRRPRPRPRPFPRPLARRWSLTGGLPDVDLGLPISSHYREGLQSREKATRTLVKATQLGSWCEPTDWHARACPTLQFIPLGYI